MEEQRKKRILFVDDEQNVLNGLRRMLHSMRDKWDMSFAISGEEALNLMGKEPYDVIVADIRMPGMDGVELLNKVMKLYPQTIRIAFSGQTDKESILRSVGPVHLYLTKPCDVETLKSTLLRALELRERLRSNRLKRLISRMKTLPSLPSLYMEIVRELQSPNPSIKRVGQIISRDMGMTAKILQLVNSAFFGLQKYVTNPVQAVTLLGLETIKTLVLWVNVFSQFDKVKLERLSLRDLWNHSFFVGMFAQQIARVEKAEQRLIDDAFTAGLLHDVGKLIFAVNLPVEYLRVITISESEGVPLYEAELRVFNSTHAEVGAYLLGIWGLPDTIVEALAFHHNPGANPVNQFTPLTAVHVADVLEQEIRSYKSEEINLDRKLEIDMSYLDRIGLTDRISIWREVCQEIIKREGER